jgi:hypothetical protein
METSMPQSAPRNAQSINHDHGATARPVEKFRDGPVHVSIWENSGAKGPFRAASFELRYRSQDDEWQTGKSYSSNALLHLESSAREARARIEKWQQGTRVKPAARQ